MNLNKKEKNRLKNLQTEYDIVIIGGGITGANALWDATLRGYRALLIEKSDFASGTSQATSKLIHGGLRYLKNYEFGLVRESLRERRILAKITPHSLRPMGFMIPIRSWFSRIQLFLGLSLYQILAWDRNRDIPEDVHLPEFRWNSKFETIYKLPSLLRDRLLGSFQYYDYANLNPERHTTEFIFAAKEKGGTALNYAEVTLIKKQNKEGYTIGIKDNLYEDTRLISAKVLINSAGPWADKIENMTGIPMEKALVRSKGIHAVVRNITGKECSILVKQDGSHLFVIPWRDKTIIGTTDTKFEGEPDHFKVSRTDLVSLLDEVNRSFGFARLSLDDIDYFYGGLRPLVVDPGEPSNTYQASRKSEILHHDREGFPGFFSALGGKYTTSRHVAELLLNQIDSYFGTQKTTVVATHFTPLLGGRYADFKTLIQEISAKYPAIPGQKIETLVLRYGSVTWKILNRKGKDIYLAANGEVYYEEEVEYLVQEEDIKHLTDFYFRRSGYGTVGKPRREERDRLDLKIMNLLGWSKSRLREEVNQVDQRYLWEPI